MANLIPVIAKELGVEIDEEFDVNIPFMGQAKYYRYKLTNIGLWRRGDGVDWVPASGSLERLVCGDYEIIKLPFEPKLVEAYWTYSYTNFSVVKVRWHLDAEDYYCKACGCVFRTKEEAIKARPAKYKELTGKDWEGER